MLRSYLGQIGHSLSIIAFLTSLLATYVYVMASKKDDVPFWKNLSSKLFFVHGVAVIGVVATLFTIIINKYFEYHYAWDNTSLSLPFGYAISTFWQDQEGSFLLWMFWDVIVGFALIFWFRNKGKVYQSYESPMMAVFSAVQAFLGSMIIGAVIVGDFKLGSTPFLLLKESMPHLSLWATNPDFVPKDGNGLNPLLQNYWMVIHPPTTFLGFAMTTVPFAFAIAALWKKDYEGWIKVAQPWTLSAAILLGVGIMMGAIWAYETLNFGGYWNWDPVENAVYVPWLVMVGALHTMMISHKSSSALKTTFILAITQFILILYSTFLTRSGVLGSASVHSFTDLGLSGQLLVYLFFFIIIAVVLLVWRWKELPRDEEEVSTYSSDFWIFIGVTVLVLAAFQLTVTTSIPVYNKIGEVFGLKLNMAMPTDPIEHFTVIQMWLFIAIVILTGIAQYYFWKNQGKLTWNKLVNPLVISLFLTAIIITLSGVNKWQYIVLLAAGMFCIVANLNILFYYKKMKIAGGAVSHIGVALMLIGIMYSSAYEKVISLNFEGNKLFQDEKDNSESTLLYIKRPTRIQDFHLTYGGEFIKIRKVPGYVEKRFVQQLMDSDYKGVLRADLMDGEKILAKKGDTVEYNAENTYYQVNFKKGEKEDFNLYPRYQINPKMGNVVSPDIKHYWNKDIYSHVNYVTTGEEKQWTPTEEYQVALKDTFFLNDHVAILDEVRPLTELEGLPLQEGDVAAEATLRILERDGEKILKPIFAIKNREVWSIPVVSNELGIRAQLLKIDPSTGMFTFGINRGEKEYIIIKAIEKPHMNVLWAGTFLVFLGLGISAYRRFKLIS
ncbi:cytochrome c biogenesis protein CcsA [Leadbetterella byssophila]|uniref:cytochrome c biogenesis protein CcsA n=1 Tax=Leadbetterella byssophila TaxID=316068 RepID=UPI00399F64EC